MPMGRLGHAHSAHVLPRHQCFLWNEKPVLPAWGAQLGEWPDKLRSVLAPNGPLLSAPVALRFINAQPSIAHQVRDPFSPAGSSSVRQGL
jgi:hypothetical protein